jgi:hypothetical protein
MTIVLGEPSPFQPVDTADLMFCIVVGLTPTSHGTSGHVGKLLRRVKAWTIGVIMMAGTVSFG